MGELADRLRGGGDTANSATHRATTAAGYFPTTLVGNMFYRGCNCFAVLRTVCPCPPP